MFEYKTRTEILDGLKFYQQDILFYDYTYSGDIEVECMLDFMVPGFGLVIAEDSGGIIKESENLYVFKLGADNSYQIITKQYIKQYTVKDEFILRNINVKAPLKELRLLFRFTEDSVLKAYHISKNKNGINQETLLFSYIMPHEMKNYKIGFYSNLGNTLKFASVKSEAPSNWISNVFNSNGGRINWIRNGFQIEESEYDIEVECENNILPAGTYYFDFITDNPDMKYYIYPSEMRNTHIVRPMDEIMATKEDEKKNILDYETMSFTLEEEHAINIKFKAKYGTVKEIAIKQFKYDDFVETGYDDSKREGSYIRIDTAKIRSMQMEAVVYNLPTTALYEESEYSIIKFGNNEKKLEHLEINLNENYEYQYSDKTISVNGKSFNIGKEKYIYLLSNVDAIVTKLVIDTIAGDTIDILHQQTMKVNVSETIDSPIIVTGKTSEPFELSGSFREMIEPARVLECFNKYNEIKLAKRLVLNGADVRIAGVSEGQSIDTSKNTIEHAAEAQLISKDKYTVDYEHNKIRLLQSVRNQYKYVLVEYNTCDNFRYEFTNYEREIFELANEQNLYLEAPVCKLVNAVKMYGIRKGALLLKDLLYRVHENALTMIDYCCEDYVIISSTEYSISSTGKINISESLRAEFDYLIVDYIKDNSYAVNERQDWYELDIATTEPSVNIIYDADENDITHKYSVPTLSGNVEQGNFIVLRKQEK